MWADQFSFASRTIPKKVAIWEWDNFFADTESGIGPLLLTLLLVNKTACDLDAEILKPFADRNLAMLLSCFCMRVVIAREEVPVVQRAMLSASIGIHGQLNPFARV